MRPLLRFCLLAALALPRPLAGAAPLAVVRVVREGLPPYEDSDRLYRLEGDGCGLLRPGQVVLLVRPGARLGPGQLEVVSVQPEFALARLRQPGAGSFPMIGDLAVPQEPLRSLPALPTPGPALSAAMRGLPAGPAAPAPAAPAPYAAHREPIYFLPGQTGLTPGAQAKLKAWVKAWGRAGRWVLALAPPATPQDPARIEALREELARLGVRQVTVVAGDPAAPGAYPAIYVLLNPS